MGLDAERNKMNIGKDRAQNDILTKRETRILIPENIERIPETNPRDTRHPKPRAQGIRLAETCMITC